MKKRYLFFDIDGTLIAAGYGNAYVPPSCTTALDKLREAGHFLAISTGRSEAMARWKFRRKVTPSVRFQTDPSVR